MSLILPSNVRPSYQAGYARNASESACPELWPDHAWVPAIGNTGNTIRDVSGGGRHGTGPNLDANWSMVKGILEFSCDGVDQYVSADYAVSYPFSVSLLARRESSGHDDFTIWGSADSSVVDYSYRIGFDFQGKAVLKLRGGGGTATITGTSGTLFDDTDWHVLTVVFVSATYRELYVDYWRDTNTINRNANGHDVIALGAAITSTPIYGRSRVGRAFVYNRALTHNEAMRLYTDPLAPLRRKIHIPLVSAAAAPPAGTDFPFHLYYAGGGVM